MNPSNVLLSAIISLFATMVVFGGCLWCLYRYRHCIGNCNSNSAGVARNSRDAGMATVDQIQVADVHPSAPPEDDKDLPPSYEALFPASPSAR
uniref:Putative secreted protein n=1 Tax=Psorophora albipes TaxID=869069 RepID=T1E3E1_9DIPT